MPGLVVGFGYMIWGAESESPSPRARDYRRAIWNDVLKNRSVCALVTVSTLRAMGQTALASFLPLFLSLHLNLPAASAGAYMSILFLFAGIAPAFVGWISDRFGQRLLIMVFSFISGILVFSVPSLGSGVLLGVGLALLGAFLWALRPVIVSAAMSAAPLELSGSIVAFIYGANMSVSFLAPLLAGLIADTYGLPAAIMSIAFFPIAAAVLTLSLLKERAHREATS
jgi:MFS transporter, FSR family, fosmidomycin resistance protein